MINHKESIDALRKIKKGSSIDVSPPKQFKENSLRAQFKSSLVKLLANETREQGMKELKNLIVQYKTTSSLRIWLSVLSQNRTKNNQGEVLVIGFILNQYKKGLIDPLDKTPSLQKTVFRVIQLIRKFFNDENFPVQMACQKSWLQIYKSSLEGESTQVKKRLAYETLQALINGGADKHSQITAQIIIDGLLETSLSKSDLEFFREIAKPTLVMFLKTNIVHPSSITSLQTILSFFKLSDLKPIAQNIIDKVIYYINSAPSNSMGYKIKSEGCNTLGMAAQQRVSWQLQPKVMPILESLATDRVWAVQMAARKALEIWKRLKQSFQRQEEQRQSKLKQVEPLKQSIQSLYLESKHGLRQFQLPQNKPQSSQTQPKRPHSYIPQYQEQRPNTSGGYLRKDQGNGGGYLHQPLAEQKLPQSQNKRMADIRQQIHKPQSDIIDFEQTIPYEQNENLHKFKAQTAPSGFHKTDKQSRIVQAPPDQDQRDENLLDQWQKVLQLYQSQRLEEAYKLILSMDDDIYMIRLLVKTGPVLDKLTKPTSTRLLKKLLQIMKSDFITQLLLSTVSSSIKNKVPSVLENRQNKSILDILSGLTKVQKYARTASTLQSKYQDVLSDSM